MKDARSISVESILSQQYALYQLKSSICVKTAHRNTLIDRNNIKPKQSSPLQEEKRKNGSK